MNISEAQPFVWKRLTKIKSNKKIGNSYLFSGPVGCGKEWSAIEFARLINCESHEFSSCASCSSCLKFSNLQHENLNLIFPLPSTSKLKAVDDPIKGISKEDYELVLQLIDLKAKDPFCKISIPKARRITINSIRFLRKSLYLKSQNTGRKIVIIFDAHLLSEGAGESANALLKILEEPPNNTSIILVTDKKSKLPLTITSRCQQIDFSNLSFDKARELIENDKVDNDRATQLAMLSNGNMHLAKELVLKDIDRPLKEAYNLLVSLTFLDQNTWRNTINNLSMLAFRSPEEFIFKISLIQMWVSIASRFKLSKQEISSFDQYFKTFEEFNNKYPNADFFEINNLLEDAMQALNRNLYMPLFILNMMITIQSLLKGEKPKITL
tara:strand:+ start:6103 stop:7248 length:1146 start_codon:yes stop_codon:yes gene_type:complete